MKKTPIQVQLLLVTIIVGNDIDWRCTDSHPVRW
jgi:hypothetical protein